jgi:phosphinothricin acetyltransferase
VPRTVAEQEAWIVEHSGPYPALAALTSTGKSPGQSPGQSTGAGESTGAGDELVGFASTSPYRPRPAYSTTVETSVYVRADHQGRGIGRLLMEQLVDAGVAHGFHSMVARIVGGHDASIRLHEKVGFRIVGTEIEIGRKFGKWLDVVVMQRML